MTQVYAQAQAAGQDDLTFIDRFRELAYDQPRFFNENFTGDGTTTSFACQRGRINDDQFLAVTVTNVAVPTTQTWPPPAGQVYVAYDTAELIFGTAPPSATKNVAIAKRIVRWRDGTILSALLNGLAQCWPALWTTYVDTSLSIIQDTYDYQLPPQFNDPAVRIKSVAVQEIPSTIEPFRKVISWDRVGTNQLHIYRPNRYTPGAVLRIEYMGPFTSLGDLQPQAHELPVLYAAGSLLGYGEANRSRTDTMTVQGAEQSLPPGQMQAAGGYYMQQFDQIRANLATPMPLAGFRSTQHR